MKINIYGIFDSKAKVFSRPFFVPNHAVAKRMLAWLARDPQSEVSKAPVDYTLFHIAVWDDEAGTIVGLDRHENLGSAAQFVQGE